MSTMHNYSEYYTGEECVSSADFSSESLLPSCSPSKLSQTVLEIILLHSNIAAPNYSYKYPINLQ